MEFSIKISK